MHRESDPWSLHWPSSWDNLWDREGRHSRCHRHGLGEAEGDPKLLITLGQPVGVLRDKDTNPRALTVPAIL